MENSKIFSESPEKYIFSPYKKLYEAKYSEKAIGLLEDIFKEFDIKVCHLKNCHGTILEPEQLIEIKKEDSDYFKLLSEAKVDEHNGRWSILHTPYPLTSQLSIVNEILLDGFDYHKEEKIQAIHDTLMIPDTKTLLRESSLLPYSPRVMSSDMDYVHIVKSYLHNMLSEENFKKYTEIAMQNNLIKLSRAYKNQRIGKVLVNNYENTIFAAEKEKKKLAGNFHDSWIAGIKSMEELLSSEELLNAAKALNKYDNGIFDSMSLGTVFQILDAMTKKNYAEILGEARVVKKNEKAGKYDSLVIFGKNGFNRDLLDNTKWTLLGFIEQYLNSDAERREQIEIVFRDYYLKKVIQLANDNDKESLAMLDFKMREGLDKIRKGQGIEKLVEIF